MARHPKLKARRNNVDPKCATCSWWTETAREAGFGKCGLYRGETQDLSVCSMWRDTPEQQVIGPDGDTYE